MLSKRLKVIADMVDTKSIIDVGCDHALLDIYLAKQKGIKCIAIDVREGIIKNVTNTVKKEKLENKVKVVLNDGLNGIEINNQDTVILSGLGTNTILNIVSGKKISNLIIQSNDDLYILRKVLTKSNYYIVDEKIVFDGKYYVVIKFKLGKVKYTNKELLFGPKLLKDKSDTLKKYLSMKKSYYEKLVKTIPNSHLIRKLKLKIYLNKIKKTLTN